MKTYVGFVRNVHLGDLLENFLIAAISSILIIRFYLAVTGYPQIGGGSFHIAHMLWGGFLLMIALVLVLSFLGNRMLRVASIIGGIGFGAFIDELGKFITSDNNYFFEPTLALLYVIFLLMIFIFRYIEGHRPLNQKEYVLNAFQLFEEVVNQDMDKYEKKKFLQYIRHAKNYPFSHELEALANKLEVSPARNPNKLEAVYDNMISFFESFIESVLFRKFVIIFFVLQAIIMLGNILLIAAFEIGSIPLFIPDLSQEVNFIVYGEIFSIILSGVFVLLGLGYFRFSRERAYEMFKYSVIVSILITQFFVFYREQFQALVGLVINLVVLAVLNFVITYEKKTKGKLPHKI
jgi:hypothetical protein